MDELNKKYNKIFMSILFALIVVGLMSGGAFAQYTGEADFGKSQMGQKYDNSREYFGTGTEGQAAPTAGMFPICGSNGTNNYAITTDTSGHLQVDVLALTGIEFSVTIDSSTDPAKLAAVAGYDGSTYRRLTTDASGNLQVDVLALPAGNLGQQAMAASLSVVPASDITDATYIGDINFGESLPAGTNALGSVTVTALSGADFTKPDGSTTAPATNVVIAGWDGSNVQTIITDATGNLQVDVLALPAGNLGQQVMAVSLSVVPASNIADGTYLGDINFGESLPAGTNAIGTVEVTAQNFTTPAGSTTSPDEIVIIGGYDGANYQELSVDTNGNANVVLQDGSSDIGIVEVNVLTGANFTKPTGTSTAPAVSVVVAGWDGSAVRTLTTDASGNLQVDVLTLPDVTITATNYSQVEGTLASQVDTVQNGLEDNGGLTQNLQGDSTKTLKVTALPFADASSATVNLATTDETTMLAAHGSGKLRVWGVFSADTACEIVIRDGTAGTVLARFYVTAGGSVTLRPSEAIIGGVTTLMSIESTTPNTNYYIKHDSQ